MPPAHHHKNHRIQHRKIIQGRVSTRQIGHDALRVGLKPDLPADVYMPNQPVTPVPIAQAATNNVASAASRAAAIGIALAAKKLTDLRDNWLNPAQWVEWVITAEEKKAGYPKRPQAKAGHADDLKKRTLTQLYNTRPTWLVQAHADLDLAVASAYGWADYSPALPDDAILRRLLALNQARSANPEK